MSKKRGKTLIPRIHLWLVFICLGLISLIYHQSVFAARPTSVPSPKWKSEQNMFSANGFADLDWEVNEPGFEGVYRLTEIRPDGQFESMVGSSDLKIYRIEPGNYEFQVAACERQEGSEVSCGRPSRKLALEVSADVGNLQTDRFDEAASGDSQQVPVTGGPVQLKPGSWFNPDRSGHGWSFHWANRLSLPESDSSHGNSYDLLGTWYTYEAKSRFLDGPDPCGEGGNGPSCYWVFENYLPLAARLRLIQVSPTSYSGGIFIRRNGQEVQEGTVTVTFDDINTSAQVDWSVDFKWQRMSGTDPIVLLAGSTTADDRNATHYSGLWMNDVNEDILIAENIGSFSESLELIFPDVNGDSAWIQAALSGQAVAEETSLCFYYVSSGYPPDGVGGISLVSDQCDLSQASSEHNRNGLRRFVDFEAGLFWADFSLPAVAGGGSIRIGNSDSPELFRKAAGFHRIYYSQPGSTCEISAGSPVCSVLLTWFTDGDYPNASAFLLNETTGQRQSIAVSDEPVVLDHEYQIGQAGSYVFELRMGVSENSSLIARSARLLVTEAQLLAPFELYSSWIDEQALLYELRWSHDRPAAVDWYELSEDGPGDGAAVLYSTVDSSYRLAHPNGPFGDYRYRVRACSTSDTGDSCSNWSTETGWHIEDPGSQNETPLVHPWGDNAEGSGALSTNRAWHYALGYHFVPGSDGQIRELGGYFNGLKEVRLFERQSGQLLAQTWVNGTNAWSYAPIEPVPVRAGEEYTVAVYLAGSGGSKYSNPVLPVTHGDLTILGSTYAKTSNDPDARPVNLVTNAMYGQADIGFSANSSSQNSPPEVHSPGAQINYQGDVVQVLLEASDPEGSAVSCEFSGLPPGVSETAECLLEGTVTADPGFYTVDVVASDGENDSPAVSFSWEIRTNDVSVANPEVPPQPAPRPSFAVDGESASTGSTRGEVFVDEQGASNYRMPLLTAPGSGGLAPQLSLLYNSRNPSEIAGVGWGIGGLSAVTRCPQTAEQDGIDGIAQLTFTAQDRFCLDGRRLMLISGIYGENGAEYRTEVDAHARIVSYGEAGTGPAWFKVWHGDGSFSEYGGTPDSRVELRLPHDGETVFSWARNRLEDSSGNFIEFEFHEAETGPVEITPLRVSYTGNSRASTLPYAQIRFIYDEARTDVPPAYVHGAEFSRTRLLTRIDSVAKVRQSDGAFSSLRSWFLGYGQDGHGRKILESIQECSDSSASTCFNPTVFDWLKNEHGISSSQVSVGHLFSRDFRGMSIADVNGDGLGDVLIIEKADTEFSFRIGFTSLSGSITLDSSKYAIPDNGIDDEPVNPLTIDLNADGLQDIIYPRERSGSVSWVARISQGVSFTEETVVAENCCFLTRPQVARVMDFNGDGLADLLTNRDSGDVPGRGDLVVLINGFSSSGQAGFEPFRSLSIDYSDDLFPEGPTSGGWYLDESAPRFLDSVARSAVGAEPFDYNGDGKVDLVARIGRKYTKCDFNCTIKTPGLEPATQGYLFEYPDGAASDEDDAQPPDAGEVSANASLFIVFESDGDDRYVQKFVAATGAGSECAVPDVCDRWSHLPSVEQVLPVDINADGLADFSFRDGVDSWYYQLNTGTHLKAPQLVANPPEDGRSHLATFVDVSGDGYPELLYPSTVNDSRATWVVHANDLASGFAAAETTSIKHGNRDQGDASVLHDLNGDGMLDNLFIAFRRGVVSSKQTRLYLGRNLLSGKSHQANNVLSQVTSGAGARTELSYKPLTDSEVYTRMRDASQAQWGRGAPVFDLVTPIYVVSRLSLDAPDWEDPAARARTEYHYAGARIQAGGRGFLGFGEVVTWNPHTQVRLNNRYRQDFPLVGALVDSLTVLAEPARRFGLVSDPQSVTPVNWPQLDAGLSVPPVNSAEIVISHSAKEWQAMETLPGTGAWSVAVGKTLERNFTLGGGLSKKALLSNRFLSHGRLSESRIETWDQEGGAAYSVISTVNHYADVNPATWILSRISETRVTHERRGATPLSRRVRYEYDPETGLMTREITEPGSSLYQVGTEYQMDVFGNRVKILTSGAGMDARIVSSEFDALGRFELGTKNHFGQMVSTVEEWDVFGNALRVSNIDDVVSYQASDPMGHVFISWSETGAWNKTTKRSGPGEHCPVSSVSHMIVESGGSPTRIRCFDNREREHRSAVEGFDGRYIYSDSHFDFAGRPSMISEPYFQGESIYWNRTEYDELGRILAVESAGGDEIYHAYDEEISGRCGFSEPNGVRISNALGQDKIEVHNVLGEKIAVFDDDCGVVSYRYDAIGNLIEVVGTDQALITMRYDGAGRKISLSDPDKGYWQYAWNPLGEMTRQLDSKGQAIDFQRDALGRITDRWELTDVGSLTDTNFSVSHHEKTQWQNGTASGVSGKSQAISVIYQAGDGSEIIHKVSLYHDSFGRLQQRVSDQSGRQFLDEITYDQFGRVFQEFDASGDFRGIKYTYNTYGYIHKVRESREGVSGQVYQEVLAMDARGNANHLIFGNGVEAFSFFSPSSGQLLHLNAFDRFGAELQELNFVFDAVGNLKQRRDQTDGRDLTEDFSYDNLNRLVRIQLTAPAQGHASPTETLAIEYDASGNITRKSDVGYYLYGSNGAGPHAVSSAGGVAYSYDANGNQVSGDGRVIEYSVFDKAVSISKNGQSTEFMYGAGNRRISRLDRNPAGDLKTTHYAGRVEYIEEAGSVRFKRMLGGVAIADFYPGSGVVSVKYLLKDQLGSIHSVTDESGRIQNATWMSFNAFGQRRTVDWQYALSFAAVSSLNEFTTRGFTGHEHVDELGLIHMNGRMYDPRLGRFIQADPFVQSATNGQNLNRYSYALNNPLSYTDPSGFFLKRLVKRWGRLIAAIAISVILPGAGGLLAMQFGIGSVYLQAAITGFIAGAIASGTFKGAVIGAITAVAVTGVVQAFTNVSRGAELAKAHELMPQDTTMQKLYGTTAPTEGLYRIEVLSGGAYERHAAITTGDILNNEIVFTNGMKNNFSEAIRNGTMNLHKIGLLKDSYILNFNQTNGFVSDLVEASKDIVGAHFGGTHSSLARNLGNVLHQVSERGISGIQLVGHSQGGAITASALRYASEAGLNLSALSGGAVALHGAPVNAWYARTRLANRAGVGVASRAQFGDAVHVLGGLNLTNPIELPVTLLRLPALFSPDPSLSPHSLPCGGGRTALCGY